MSSMSKRILLYTTEKINEVGIERALLKSGYRITHLCDRISDVTRNIIMGNADYLLVISNEKMDGLLACVQQLQRQQPVPVVIFSNRDSDDDIQMALLAGVSSYITTDQIPERLDGILRTAEIRFTNENSLREELSRTTSALDERKLIEKAKGIVMQRSEIDEDEAYKAMRKMAMDRNIKLSELAQSVISASEMIN